MQETNLNIKQEYSLKGLWEDANFILNCGPNQSGNGVAIVSLVPNIEMVHAFSDCNGKVMAVDIEMYQEKFRLVNVHFPNRDGGMCKEQK